MPQVSYINVNKVLNVICKDISPIDGYMDVQEELLDRAFDWVSFGDASYTLVGNNIFIESVLQHMKHFYSLSDSQLDDIRKKFWSIVEDQVYINMES